MKPGGSVESSCCGWELSLGGKVATEIWDLAEEFYLNWDTSDIIILSSRDSIQMGISSTQLDLCSRNEKVSLASIWGRAGEGNVSGGGN